MASTYSPSLRIELIGAGDQAGTWNTTTNSNLGTIIESAIAGYVAVSVTSANQAFTALDGAADQARNAVIALTTTTGANFAVYAPPQEKTYVIYNTTAFTATVYNSTVLGNTTAAGLGVAVAAGGKVAMFSDGTNFRTTDAGSFSGTLPVVNGGTGVTTAAAVASLVGNLLFPVGAIYSSTSATNPGTSLGFGTWTTFGGGRMLIGVGVNGGQTFAGGAVGGDFAPALLNHTHTGTTGGQSANHTHFYTGTTSSAGTHAHDFIDVLVPMSLLNPSTLTGLGRQAYSSSSIVAGPHTKDAGAHEHTYSGFTGGVTADHNHSFTTAASSSGDQTTGNLPPYVAVYMWQRTS
jgi:hypothetical protein